MTASAPPAARLGRRLGIAAFAAFVAIPTLVWTSQILRTVWTPAPGPAVASCRVGLRGLLEAVDRARLRVASAEPGERAGISAFRSGLLPEWESRGAVENACAGDAQALGMLREIDGLRYAEEHAVRYEADSLARQRRRALQLRGELAVDGGGHN
jgi:hypothetical protein